MNHSRCTLRRLILGLSVEDAQSKFDTPESRNILRVAHERYNQGIYHELQVAQRQRNGLAPERKCHISRFTKPTVPGFQAYVKGAPDDYVIREVWDDGDDEAQAAAQRSSAGTATAEDGVLTHSSAIPSVPAVSAKITHEQEAFKNAKTVVLRTLASALQLVMENVLAELQGRRQSGALLSKEQQTSVVDRLVNDAAAGAGARSYKSLSSSSHLLEPVEMAVTLFGRKDAAEVSAFKSGVFAVPAAEGNISYSLWVAGGLVASTELIADFPFHLAKFAAPAKSASSPSRLPHVEVEIYFSAELFQLEKAIGQNGIRTLRVLIGRTMMRQHEPTPTSTSLLLAAGSDHERELYNIYDPALDRGEVRIPWIRKMVTKVSTVTGVVFSAEDSDENPSADRMRATVLSVWRAWGHLVKDLHVHGDLDYLYVSISRRLEWEGNEGYIAELKELEAARNAEESAGPVVATANIARTLNAGGSLAAIAAAAAGVTEKARRQYLPIAADFVVVECTLERKGLPHNMVVEDIVSTLTDMQQEQLEMQRLSVLDTVASQAEENEAKSGASSAAAKTRDRIVPVLYEPKVVVSHAGALENGTHSFQRVRIRGSCRAHIETLAAALQDESGSYFTDRALPSSTAPSSRSGVSGSGGVPVASAAPGWAAPKNLSFRAVRAASDTQRLIGHSAPANAAGASGAAASTAAASSVRHARVQVATVAADGSAVVSEEEQQFWTENYYRLTDVKVVFHDRVDAADALGQSWQSLPPRVQEHLALVNRRLSSGDSSGVADETGAGAAVGGEEEEEVGTGKRKRKKAAKKKGKPPAAEKGKSKQQHKAAEAATVGLPPERLFEYLCTDMEAESARHDLHTGDCTGYDYLLSLRRIPDKHLPLVKPAVASVANKGFINYYGPQRFATYTRMNMHPGLHLLKGEYKAAAHILVQQFYLDAAMEAERRRTGQAFPRMQALQGYGGVRLPDFLRAAGARRSVAEHGTPMQRVLYNALQAAALLGDSSDGGGGGGDFAASDGAGGLNGHGGAASGQRRRRGKPLSPDSASGGMMAVDVVGGAPAPTSSTPLIDDDPCAEAFLRVIGPRACAMLVQEFLCFVWNDVVSQRLQRYGTFTLLPGDLVRPGGVAGQLNPDAAAEAPPFAYASRAQIERGALSAWDLVLPLPGADVRLPQNHTEDLYVVTMQRYGLPFDPESRQWRCFKPSPLIHSSGKVDVTALAAAATPPSLSPYYNLTSTFALMEEELGTRTPATGVLLMPGSAAASDDSSLQTDGALDARELRPDLRSSSSSSCGGGGGIGNALGLTIGAAYRHPLVQPNGDVMQWRLLKGVVGDPYQRWGATARAQVRGSAALQLDSTTKVSGGSTAWLSAGSSLNRSSGSQSLARLPSRGGPRLLNVESGVSVLEEEEDEGEDGVESAAAVTELAQARSSTPPPRATSATATAATTTAARYRHPRCWRGASQLVRNSPMRSAGAAGGRASAALQEQQPPAHSVRRRRTPPAPSWLPRHHGSTLQLRLRLPTGVYPGMLVRELLKMDVSTPDVVDLDRGAASSATRGERRAQSWQDLTPDQRATYEKWLTKRRQQRRVVAQPRAISLALLHQQIFRSSGVRQSLLPTLRSYDSVAK